MNLKKSESNSKSNKVTSSTQGRLTTFELEWIACMEAATPTHNSFYQVYFNLMLS